MSVPINKYEEQLKLLKQYAKMETQDDIKNFEILAWELAKTRDVDVLAELFGIFDDNCPYPEVMWGLIHAVEKYDREIYIVTLLKNLHIFYKSYEWCYILFCGILNHSPSLEVLENNLHIANKKQISKVFDMIYRDSERHQPIVENLRLKLNS